MIDSYLRILERVLLYLVLIPVTLSALLSWISRYNKQLVVNRWGVRPLLFFGGVGIIIHELSHFIVALLFRHQVTRVSLLRLPKPNDPTDNRLGSVEHQWNPKSFYQQAGNVFIGIAPIIGNVVALVLFTNWLVPNLISGWSTLDFFTNTTLSRFLIWLFLTINISIGGFDLSRADLVNSRAGLLTLVALILLVSLICALIPLPTGLTASLTQLRNIIYFSLIFSLVFNLLTLAFLKGLTSLGN